MMKFDRQIKSMNFDRQIKSMNRHHDQLRCIKAVALVALVEVLFGLLKLGVYLWQIL